MSFFAFTGFIVWSVLMVVIFRKAGYSGLQILLLFIPGINVIIFIWFALTEWPIEREVKRLRFERMYPRHGPGDIPGR